MPSEEKTPTQKEIEMQAIEEIGKQITDYFLYVVKHMKFDENGNPIATPELKEYMENERKKFKERSKVFSDKAFSEYLQQHISKSLSESEEWAAACARAKEAGKQRKTFNFIEDETKPAEYYLFARDRINNKLLNEPISDGTELIIDEKGRKNSGVNSILYFNIDSAAEETDLNERNITLSEFDKQIQNAVISLMRAGNKIITHQSIYQVLAHSSAPRLTDKWKEKIETSMLKLQSIKITADFSNAFKYYPELEIKKFKEKTNLLEFKEVEVEHRNGTIGKGYKMLDEPVLYRIAEAKKQIGTITLKGLTNKKTANTVDVSILYNWLLVRIDGMKHPKNPLSKTITLDDMYSSLNRTTRRSKITTRENAEMLLIQFKADKLIKDFEFVSEKNKITKINIYV